MVLRSRTWGIWASIAALLVGMQMPPRVVAQDVQVRGDVEFEFEATKQTPHPTSYVWYDSIPVIREPGPYYYHFFYTGRVNPDARVPRNAEIQRIPVPMSEWNRTGTGIRARIIEKLTSFYQAQNPNAAGAQNFNQGFGIPGQEPGLTPGGGFNDPGFGGDTGFGNDGFTNEGFGGDPGFTNDFAAEPGFADDTGFGADPGFGDDTGFGADPGFGDDTGFGADPGFGGPVAGIGEDNFGQAGAAGGGFNNFNVPQINLNQSNTLDPRAAAEWTFYYDQFVLWQYYTGRVLLNDAEDDVLETPSQEIQLAQTSLGAPNLNGNDEPGGFGNQGPGGFGQPGAFGQGGAGVPGQNPAAAQGQQGGGFIDDFSGGFYSQRGVGGGNVNPQQGTLQAYQRLYDQTGELLVREAFFPGIEYDNPQYNMIYLERYKEVNEDNEEDLYNSFVDMVNEIDGRELNHQRYEDWIAQKRQEVFNFAENWRQVEDGETLLIDGRLFLITEKPLEAVPVDAINVQRSEKLTPQDLLADDGSVREPDGY